MHSIISLKSTPYNASSLPKDNLRNILVSPEGSHGQFHYSVQTCLFFLHTSFIKIEKFRYFSGGRQIYLTLLAWLLIQDKKSTRLNSIVSSPKQLLPAILFNKTRLHWCEFIGYILDSHSLSTKNKSKLHLFSI